MTAKRILLALYCLCCLTTAYAGAEITWIDGTVHDFGAFHESAEHATCVFRYVNTGDDDLVIIGARASCGCTTPRYNTRPIAPGDTASITVAYDSQGRPGRFAKSIFVDANTTPRRSVLTVKGIVIGAPETVAQRFPVDFGPLKMAYNSVLLGKIDRHHVKSVFADGYNASTDSLSLTILYHPKWVEVTPTPRDIPPGERVSLSFFVNADRVPQYGINLDSVIIAPDKNQPQLRYTLPVSVNVGEDFSKMDARALARAPQAAVDTQMLNVTCDGTATLRLYNRGDNDALAIRRIYSPSAALQITPPKKDSVKRGKSADITLAIDRNAVSTDNTLIDTQLFIITNDPTNPVIIVRITSDCKL